MSYLHHNSWWHSLIHFTTHSTHMSTIMIMSTTKGKMLIMIISENFWNNVYEFWQSFLPNIQKKTFLSIKTTNRFKNKEKCALLARYLLKSYVILNSFCANEWRNKLEGSFVGAHMLHIAWIYEYVEAAYLISISCSLYKRISRNL